MSSLIPLPIRGEVGNEIPEALAISEFSIKVNAAKIFSHCI